MNHKIDKYFILIFLLIVFHLLFNSLWIIINKNPLDFDPIGHSFATINSAHYLGSHLLSFSLKDFMKISPGYPNFTQTAILPLVFLFGNYWKVIQFSGTIFFLLAIIAIYLYVKTISQNGRFAFFSAFFYSFFISIFQYSRLHMLDIPLTAMFFFSLYLWEKFQRTYKYRYLYLSAVTIAFAQLSKWHAVVFFFIPGVFLLRFLVKNRRMFSRRLIWPILAGLLSIMLIASWYFYNFSDFIRLGTINYLGEADDPKKFFSLATIFYYPKLIVNFQIHFFGAIFLLMAGLPGAFRRKKYLLIPLLTTVFSYLFFSFFVPNKNIRVVFPVMPFVALFMAEGVEKLLFSARGSWLNWMASIFSWVVVLYMVVAYFVLSFGFPINLNWRYSVRFPLAGWIDLIYLKSYPVNLLPTRQTIDYKDIIETILSQKGDHSRLKVLVGIHQSYFHEGTLGLEIYMENRQNLEQAYETLSKKIELIPSEYLLNKNQSLVNSLDDIDIILTSEKNSIHPEEVLNPLYEPLRSLQNFLKEGNDFFFRKVASFPLPNEDVLLIYVNKRLVR